MKSYLVYHVDKGLSVVSAEALYYLDLVRVGEGGRQQKYAFIRGEGMVDELFPGWGARTAHEKTIRLKNR